MNRGKRYGGSMTTTTLHDLAAELRVTPGQVLRHLYELNTGAALLHPDLPPPITLFGDGDAVLVSIEPSFYKAGRDAGYFE